MPLARYFVFVGGVLLALLFIFDAFQPKLPVADATDAGVDKSIIRIHSDRKWPERVVFDTSLPTIAPAQTVKAQAAVPAPATVADVPAKVRVREAFAQLPFDPKQAQPSEPKRPEQKLQRKRKIVKNRAPPPVMLVAQQPRFGFFGNSIW
jgi:hypothetical protein